MLASAWRHPFEPSEERRLRASVALVGRPSGAAPGSKALGADTDVDVAVVGAGFTGLWAAYYLLRASPGIRVAVMEKEVAGFGASGRNGGWCSALFPVSDGRLVRQLGAAAARAMRRAMQQAVDEVGRAAADRRDRLLFCQRRDRRRRPQQRSSAASPR